LEIDPKQDWGGEYNLLTKIWGKWFSEMGIESYSFVKNDNVSEIKESIEKFMQVSVPGKVQPMQWTAIRPDTTSKMLSENFAEANPPEKSFKKKDESVKKTSAKKSLKNEEVSFGPAY